MLTGVTLGLTKHADLRYDGGLDRGASIGPQASVGAAGREIKDAVQHDRDVLMPRRTGAGCGGQTDAVFSVDLEHPDAADEYAAWRKANLKP